jgi:hypothetical protein
MKQRARVGMAVGTLAVVAAALAVDSLRRSRDAAGDAEAARAVIRNQLDAFNRGDYRAAYRFAAPEIQARFPLPEFRRMVKEGYPAIARSRSVSLGRPEVRGSTAVVPITVTGPEGVAVRYLYSLHRERNDWRIAGVEEVGKADKMPPRPAGKETDTVRGANLFDGVLHHGG